MADDLQRYLATMLSDNKQVEIRVLADRQTLSGIFDNQASIRVALDELSCESFSGVYATLNRFSYREATNKLDRASQGSAVSDSDIEQITRIAFDFDPVRKRNTASTTEELLQARSRVLWLRRWLGSIGWPRPLVAMSGNGYHLQYRCDLPANKTTQDLINNLYINLHIRCSIPEVSFDRTVRNPSRIFRLYGTVARKGCDTEDRPHRESMCMVPDPWEQVPFDVLHATVEMLKPAAKAHRKKINKRLTKNGVKRYTSGEVVAMFEANGLYKRSLPGNKHSVYCPWQSEHSSESKFYKTDTVLFDNNGNNPGFHCSHDHCFGRTIGDVIRFFQG